MTRQWPTEVYPALYSGASPLNALLERNRNPAIGANERLAHVKYPEDLQNSKFADRLYFCQFITSASESEFFGIVQLKGPVHIRVNPPEFIPTFFSIDLKA
jgi:hypothetical protein